MAGIKWPLALVMMLVLCGCAPRDPVVEMQRTLRAAPEYMIVLDDMREEGAVFPQYYHRYLVTQGQRQVRTEWVSVSQDVYRRYEPFLGMALASKSGDETSGAPHPPGYQHVGNAQHGRWVERNGSSFWEFYGQYAMLRSLMDLGGMLISRADWDGYNTSRRAQRPYYGSNNEWGTQGSVTQQQRPGTFERRKQAMQQRQQSFAGKVQSRAAQGRTAFGTSGRGRVGFGMRSVGGFRR